MKRRIAIIGSTGSIGSQALDVVRQHRDLFEVELLVANSSWETLARQAVEFDVNSAVICDESKYSLLADALQDKGIKVFAGMDSACSIIKSDNVDMVLVSVVGFSGLRPTLAAIEAGKPIALANKETLVAAGSIVMPAAAKARVPIIPVDSEHSAIFQCLLGAGNNAISKIHLTASGGPFRSWDKADIAKADASMALRHPQWSMGDKITIDSATMMNKGFEMIEARWLFDVMPEDINIVVHPQSVIHSMVEFADGAVLAQMAKPDMREPIQFALAFPDRLSLNSEKLDFCSLASLTFEKPDKEKFPALQLAIDAIGRGGNIPCAMNAANEAAVAAFLGGKISFYDISEIVGRCMSDTHFIENPTLDDIFATNEDAFRRAADLVEKI